jgi:hypothetical protein
MISLFIDKRAQFVALHEEAWKALELPPWIPFRRCNDLRTSSMSLEEGRSLTELKQRIHY